jgi:hypothetical protein
MRTNFAGGGEGRLFLARRGWLCEGLTFLSFSPGRALIGRCRDSFRAVDLPYLYSGFTLWFFRVNQPVTLGETKPLSTTCIEPTFCGGNPEVVPASPSQTSPLPHDIHPFFCRGGDDTPDFYRSGKKLILVCYVIV